MPSWPRFEVYSYHSIRVSAIYESRLYNSSFLDSSLESSVSENKAEDSDEETAETECISSIINREKHKKAKTNDKSKLPSNW